MGVILIAVILVVFFVDSFFCDDCVCVSAARGQFGTDSYFCSVSYSEAAHHCLRCKILQEFPWRNFGLHSISG